MWEVTTGMEMNLPHSPCRSCGCPSGRPVNPPRVGNAVPLARSLVRDGLFTEFLRPINRVFATAGPQWPYRKSMTDAK